MDAISFPSCPGNTALIRNAQKSRRQLIITMNPIMPNVMEQKRLISMSSIPIGADISMKMRFIVTLTRNNKKLSIFLILECFQPIYCFSLATPTAPIKAKQALTEPDAEAFKSALGNAIKCSTEPILITLNTRVKVLRPVSGKTSRI